VIRPAPTDRGRASRLSRRHLLAGGAALALAGPETLRAGSHSVTVEQITDPMATAATGMFRFVPDLISLSPGGDLAILNSLAHHTVHSLPAIWPETVPPVAIFNDPRALVRLPVPGFYGFRCARHGGYGMVMLAVAGDPAPPPDLPAILRALRAEQRERDAVAALFARYAAGHG